MRRPPAHRERKNMRTPVSRAAACTFFSFVAYPAAESPQRPPPLLASLSLCLSIEYHPHSMSIDTQNKRGAMKATVRGRYEVNQNATGVATFAVNAGDIRFKASMTDATFVRGPSLNGLVLSIVKPGAFIFDCNLPNKDARFQFMNSVRLMEKTVNLTYTHALLDNRTAIDGAMALDPCNKVSVSYSFGAPGACKIKYTYAHGALGRTVLEPCYDVSKNAWDFAITRKFEGSDSLKATYHTTTGNLGLEWYRDRKDSGSFKISAAVNLAEQQKAPNLIAESMWTYEM